ncbi:hypothetical protein G2W53_030072 [Senna tora]|uniref:Uncharacterized protein n=1 Tax=Senna tora TaxID=362788 RepID=A0A834T6M4_9FABA|nr:hypothetical protein G2W53_030072 [Senna tora]
MTLQKDGGLRMNRLLLGVKMFVVEIKKRQNLGDVTINLANQSNILHEIVRDLGLVILVHLLDQGTVLIEHRLRLTETPAQRVPNLRITFRIIGGVVVVSAAFVSLSGALQALNEPVRLCYGGFFHGRRHHQTMSLQVQSHIPLFLSLSLSLSLSYTY